jgi:hypothetical protein
VSSSVPLFRAGSVFTIDVVADFRAFHLFLDGKSAPIASFPHILPFDQVSKLELYYNIFHIHFSFNSTIYLGWPGEYRWNRQILHFNITRSHPL